MNDSVSTAVQALAALVNILCLLAIVYVLHEVMLVVRDLRLLSHKPAPPAPEPPQPSVPLMNKSITEMPITEMPVNLPCVHVETVPAPLPTPLCIICKAKLRRIVNSTITDGKTSLTFKCGRCTKETTVPVELVPPELLDPARSTP